MTSTEPTIIAVEADRDPVDLLDESEVMAPAALDADRMSQAHDLPPPRETPEGHLIVWMVLARPGVYDYPEGPTLVPASTLSDDAYVSMLPGTSITDEDTGAHQSGVNPDNHTKVGVGTVLQARWNEEKNRLEAEAIFNTRRGIEAIKSGIRGVSAAYKPRYLQEEGVDAATGRKYVRIQVARMSSDNVAITRNPRQDGAELKADSMEDEEKQQDSEAPERSIEDRVADMEKAVADMRKEYDALRKEHDAMKESKEDDSEDEEEEAKDADSLPSALQLVRAASAHGIGIVDSDTEATLTRKLALAITGREADSLSSDAIEAAIRLAPKGKAPNTSGVRLTAIDSDSDQTTGIAAKVIQLRKMRGEQ